MVTLHTIEQQNHNIVFRRKNLYFYFNYFILLKLTGALLQIEVE